MESARHVREAKRRAALAGRSFIGVWDFPPSVSRDEAVALVVRSAEEDAAQVKLQEQVGWIAMDSRRVTPAWNIYRIPGCLFDPTGKM